MNDRRARGQNERQRTFIGGSDLCGVLSRVREDEAQILPGGARPGIFAAAGAQGLKPDHFFGAHFGTSKLVPCYKNSGPLLQSGGASVTKQRPSVTKTAGPLLQRRRGLCYKDGGSSSVKKSRSLFDAHLALLGACSGQAHSPLAHRSATGPWWAPLGVTSQVLIVLARR